MYKLSENVGQEVINYLSKCPYREVYHLIEKLTRLEKIETEIKEEQHGTQS